MPLIIKHFGVQTGAVLRFEMEDGVAVVLPNARARVRPGQRAAPEARQRAIALGLRDWQLHSANFSRLLAVLALCREEGFEHVTLPQLTEIGWPGRSPKSVGNELARFIAKPPRVEATAPPWPGPEDPGLVQVARRQGLADITRGPYRLNPARYPLDADIDALRCYVMLGARVPARTRKAMEDHVAISPETAIDVAQQQILQGREEEAVLVLATAAAAPAGALTLEMRGELVLRLAATEMQLGWSDEAATHAGRAEELGRRVGNVVLQAEALHIKALALRQQDDLRRCVRLDREALTRLAAASIPQARGRALRWELERSLAVSYSGLVLANEGRRAHFVSRGTSDGLWAHATRLFRSLIREADAAGDAKELAHLAMRLASHRLLQHRRAHDDDRDIARAHDLVPHMTVPMRVIWERATATEQALRAAGGQRDAALEQLIVCARENSDRGYDHQFRLIEETFASLSLNLRAQL